MLNVKFCHRKSPVSVSEREREKVPSYVTTRAAFPGNLLEEASELLLL